MSKSSSHSKNYASNLIAGFVAIIGFALVTYYSFFELEKPTNWYLWALLSASLLCIGIYFCLNAFVHKIKADFKKRAKHREHKNDEHIDEI